MKRTVEDEGIRKDAYLSLFVSKAQREALISEAKVCNLTLSEYLRRLISSRNVKISRKYILDPAAVVAINRELSRVGNNLNQIAYWYNRWKRPDDVAADELRALLVELHQIAEKLNALAEGVSHGRR